MQGYLIQSIIVVQDVDIFIFQALKPLYQLPLIFYPIGLQSYNLGFLS